MKTLLTNDDGIHAPGIQALYRALIDVMDTVFVVAPLTVQSATSHSITYHSPLLTETVQLDGGSKTSAGVAVDGRPADCTKLAITQLWSERFGADTSPDLVVSGMNAGANIGINTLYSGTVAAALEAAFMGVPAIAVSLMIGDRHRVRYDIAARHAVEAIQVLLRDGLPRPHTALNINIPVTEADGPRPALQVGPVNLSAHRDHYEARLSPAGQRYYWAAGDGMSFHETTGGSDVEIVARGRISVTPIHYDLTSRDDLDRYRDAVRED
jgi:5'-nucleotidase